MQLDPIQFIEYRHSIGLVIASLFVSIAASITGLFIIGGIDSKSDAQKKLSVALSSISLGGGIWSMHFVAMLGLRLSEPFYYDAAVTLASALFAILIVGAALILLHFTQQTHTKIIAAASFISFGVLVMHYMGMAALQTCQAVYTTEGIAISAVAAFALCYLSLKITYNQSSNINTLLGAISLGTAVFCVHFIALHNSTFLSMPQLPELGPVISNEVLALVVIFASFIIFGAFLLMSVTFLVPKKKLTSNISLKSKIREEEDPTILAANKEAKAQKPDSIAGYSRIPCAQDGGTIFVDPANVVMIQAEGHYTHIFTETSKYFCVWSISMADKRLKPHGFLKTHRSYLINPNFVRAFERNKNNGVCRFSPTFIPSIPVSRTNLKTVREVLGI